MFHRSTSSRNLGNVITRARRTPLLQDSGYGLHHWVAAVSETQRTFWAAEPCWKWRSIEGCDKMWQWSPLSSIQAVFFKLRRSQKYRQLILSQDFRCLDSNGWINALTYGWQSFKLGPQVGCVWYPEKIEKTLATEISEMKDPAKISTENMIALAICSYDQLCHAMSLNDTSFILIQFPCIVNSATSRTRATRATRATVCNASSWRTFCQDAFGVLPGLDVSLLENSEAVGFEVS